MDLKGSHKEKIADAAVRKELALELKDAFKAVSPFIERHTSILCPECEKVCCIDKHGRYDNDDSRFIELLGESEGHYALDRHETAPCRFLTAEGCSQERWMRPFRCTFFFCDPLLKSLQMDNAKLYRAFVDYFQCLVAAREKLRIHLP